MREIVFKLREEGATTLIRIELATFLGLIVLSIATISATVYIELPSTSVDVGSEVQEWINLIILAILVLVFIPFVYYFKKYHVAAYDELKKNIWSFFLVESVCCLLLICYDKGLIPEPINTYYLYLL